jgi:phosphatidylserine decarboxylase
MTVATYAAAQLLRVLPRRGITRVMGRLADWNLHPAVADAVVGLYVRAYDVDLADTVSPSGSFASFDAFFTRPLRDGARPIQAAPAGLVSPADGRLEDAGPVTAGGALRIKGRAYTVKDLVGDAREAERYEGGQFAIVYLSPRDYHRVHAPVGGRVTLVRSLPGDYFPVNSIGERHVPSLFSINRRVAIVIDSESMGRVTVVMVGAMIVGRITVTAIDARDVPIGDHVIEPGLLVAPGDEIGMFHLGSTAVVFVEKGRSPPLRRDPSRILMGEGLSSGEPPKPSVSLGETPKPRPAHGAGEAR